MLIILQRAIFKHAQKSRTSHNKTSRLTASASHLLSNANGTGVSPIVVAKYLVHTVDMLLKTYAHMLPRGKEETIKNLRK